MGTNPKRGSGREYAAHPARFAERAVLPIGTTTSRETT
jgi:hypothetical protein